MDGEVPKPQYCTNVLMFRGQRVIVLLTFLIFALFFFAQYTNLCLDTVTLKKKQIVQS